MQLTRNEFVPGSFDVLRASLRPGVWLIEQGLRPPPAHVPAVLLEGADVGDAFALSLGSAAVLTLELGDAVVACIAAAGCRLGELVGLAIHEILLNAAVHGNLEVNSGDALRWSDLAMRQCLIAASLGNATRAARAVSLAVGWRPDAAIVAIADEGAGYETQPATTESARRGAGRGLLIARAAASRIDVVAGGTCTRLTFPRHPASGAA